MSCGISQSLRPFIAIGADRPVPRQSRPGGMQSFWQSFGSRSAAQSSCELFLPQLLLVAELGTPCQLGSGHFSFGVAACGELISSYSLSAGGRRDRTLRSNTRPSFRTCWTSSKSTRARSMARAPLTTRATLESSSARSSTTFTSPLSQPMQRCQAGALVGPCASLTVPKVASDG